MYRVLDEPVIFHLKTITSLDLWDLFRSANEESGSSKSLNREQPLYGDWNLNEANHEEAFESTRNRRNDTLPSGFDFNVGVQGTQTQEQFRQPNVSTNAWKQSSFADVPQNTVPTFFTER